MNRRQEGFLVTIVCFILLWGVTFACFILFWGWLLDLIGC